MKKLSIIIPAHNEELRIEQTLREYCTFFSQLKERLEFEIIVSLNGCTDKTHEVVTSVIKTGAPIRVLDLKKAGKGLAIKYGFEHALNRPNDFIGFVDADMSTSPAAFYDLFLSMNRAHGTIASRYIKGAKIYPARPLINRWGCKLVYEPMVFLLFGLKYKDLQCGAKLFKREVVETVYKFMSIDSWAFDVELLYLCKKFGFIINELPTQWNDKAGGKLSFFAGVGMHFSVMKLRLKHSFFGQWL